MKKILFFLSVITLSLMSCESDEVDHGCGPNQIYVESYVKADGTHVNGYCRAAHNN